MVRNLIFDMGQVLIHWTPQQFVEPMELDSADRDLLLRETFHNVEWYQLDRGVITEDEAAAAICSRLPQRLHAHAQALVKDWWKAPHWPMEGMAELVRELREAGYGIYLLSNASLRLRTYFRRIPGAECFDGIFVSAEHQLLKPQHEIYEKFLEQWKLDPAECFFVDDSPANIEGAARVGIRGTVFHGDPARLRRELREAGIRCGI